MVRILISFAISFLVLSPARALAGQKKNPLDDPARIGDRNLVPDGVDLYGYPRAFEIGRQIAEEIEDLSTPYNDPETRAYVVRLTNRIARHSDVRIPVRVRLLSSREVDAFGLPGGYLFLTTGLILQTRTEAELAGVIAHEVAHIAARDATRKMTEERIWDWASLPVLMFVGPEAFTLEEGLAGPLALTAFSRSAERRADSLGLQYLYETGYDPEGFIDFFERARKLEKGHRGVIAKAFATHPLTRDRVAAAEREIERDLPSRLDCVVTTSDYQRMRNRLEQYVRDEMPLVPARPENPGPPKKARAKHLRQDDLP